MTFAADRVIRYKEVLDNLHILDYDYYFKLTDFLLAGNLPQSLLTVDEILRKGFDGHQFVVGLCRHFRDLLVCKDAATVQLLQVTESVRRQYLDQSVRAPISFLLSALSLGGQCDMNYKQAKDQRLHSELWLMKLANLRNLLDWDALPDLPLNGKHNGETTSDQLVSEKKNDKPTLNGSKSSPEQPGVPTNGSSTAPADRGNQLTESHPITSEPVNSYTPTTPTNGTSTNGTVYQNGHTVVPNSGASIAEQPVVATQSALRPDLRQKAQPPLPPRPATSRLKSTVPLAATPVSVVAVIDEDLTKATPVRLEKPFDFDQLRDVWLAFAKMRQQQNDSATEQLMLNRDLVLDGTTIQLTLDNTLQVGYLTELKPDLLGYLRNELQNSQIQIEHTVTQQEVKKMIYSSQDKYNYLAEKNPALHELRKVLNLEVDY